MQQEILFLQYFETFIKESSNGKRRTASGKRITTGTVEQYKIVAGYLQAFEVAENKQLRIKLLFGHSKKQFTIERNYWKKIKLALEAFLRNKHNCMDVYIAAVFKVIKTFFNYLRSEKGLPVGEFHKLFKLPSYSYQPVLLDTNQFQRLIHDKEFRNTLPKQLQASLDLFVFGCVAGLRYSDLMNLKQTNIYQTGKKYYLQTSAQKTGVPVIIPLPDFAVELLRRQRKYGTRLFKKLSNCNFNLHVKRIMEVAGYTYPVPKLRYRNGKLTELKTKEGHPYRFCDHISAHTMRRTAITTLLVLGVPELVVRKISGHAAGSKEFFKYISLAQDYTNRHIEYAYNKLLQTGEKLTA